MKNKHLFLTIFSLFLYLVGTSCKSDAQSKGLKLVFIRHGEKPDDGDNLNCQGLNRSMLLPAVLFKKFGIPNNIYVPSVNSGDLTKHARMLQTITPFAAKYNLSINSKFDEEDYKKVGNALLKEKGTIFIVWEHQNIVPILNYFGISGNLNWPGSDFDSIWIVTFHKGNAILTKDKEGLNPSAGCPF